MIEVFPPLGKYKYDNWRMLLVNCYIDNSVCLWNCIRNINSYTMNHVPLLCDNESAIKIAYNPCEHCRTKHIDIRHRFLRDLTIKGDIIISHVRTNDQLANIFTMPLDEKRLCEL
jgi:hypothetical protein